MIYMMSLSQLQRIEQTYSEYRIFTGTAGSVKLTNWKALEEFKKAEYIEEWAFELAKLYQEAGMTAECLEECDDLILLVQ